MHINRIFFILQIYSITQLSEDLHLKEILIYGAKAQITQLETHICYTHAHLETLKYRVKKGGL